MTDVVSPATRSRMMSAIRGANTRPEINVRKALHKAGYRFRLHRRDLPGTPDIVLPKYCTCIFVHGCFWHRHAGCRFTTTPGTRQEFWQAKFAANQARDHDVQRRLLDQGWRVIVVWECGIKRDAIAFVDWLSTVGLESNAALELHWPAPQPSK